MEKAEDRPVKEFGIDWEKGLNSEEARKRIGEYGYNEVPERRVSRTIRFIKKFWGLTPWRLEITIGLKWVLGRYFEMAGKPSDFITYSRESGDRLRLTESLGTMTASTTPSLRRRSYDTPQ